MPEESLKQADGLLEKAKERSTAASQLHEIMERWTSPSLPPEHQIRADINWLLNTLHRYAL